MKKEVPVSGPAAVLARASKINPGDLRKKRKREGEDVDVDVFVQQKIRKMQKVKYGPQDFLDQIIENNLNDAVSIFNYFQGRPKHLTEDQSRFYEQIIRATIYNTKLSLVDILGNKSFKYFISPDLGFTSTGCIFTNDRLYWLNMADKTLKEEELFPILKFDKMIVNLQSIAIPISKDYYKGFVQDYEKDFSFIGNKVLINKDNEFDKLKGFSTEDLKKYGEVTVNNFVYENSKYTAYIFEGGSALITLTETFSKVDDLKAKIKEVNIIDSKKDLKEGVKIIELKEEESIFFSQEFKLVDFAPCFISFSKDVKVPFSFLFTLEFDMIGLENYLYKKFKSEKVIGKYLGINNLVSWDTFGLMVNFLMVESVTRFKTENVDLRKNINDFIKEWEKKKIYFAQVKSRALKISKFLLKFFDSFQNKINLDVIKNLSDQYGAVYGDYKLLAKANYIPRTKELLDKYELNETCGCISNFIERMTNEELEDLMEDLGNFFNDALKLTAGEEIVEKIKSICRNIFKFMISDNQTGYFIEQIRSPSCVLGDINNTKNSTSETAKKIFTISKEKNATKISDDVKLIGMLDTISKTDAIKYLLAAYFAKKKNIRLSNLVKTYKPLKLYEESAFGVWCDEIYEKTLKHYENDSNFSSLAKLVYLNKAKELDNTISSYRDVIKQLDDLYNNYELYIKSLENEAEKEQIINDEKKNQSEIKKDESVFISEGELITPEILDKLKVVINQDLYNKNKNLFDFARANAITDDVLIEYMKKGSYIQDDGQILQSQKILENSGKTLLKKMKSESLKKKEKKSIHNRRNRVLKNMTKKKAKSKEEKKEKEKKGKKVKEKPKEEEQYKEEDIVEGGEGEGEGEGEEEEEDQEDVGGDSGK